MDGVQRVFHPLPPAVPFSAEVEALPFVELHDAVFELSPDVASFLWKVLEGMGRLIDHATQERVQLALQLSARQVCVPLMALCNTYPHRTELFISVVGCSFSGCSRHWDRQ